MATGAATGADAGTAACARTAAAVAPAVATGVRAIAEPMGETEEEDATVAMRASVGGGAAAGCTGVTALKVSGVGLSASNATRSQELPEKLCGTGRVRVAFI